MSTDYKVKYEEKKAEVTKLKKDIRDLKSQARRTTSAVMSFIRNVEGNNRREEDAIKRVLKNH